MALSTRRWRVSADFALWMLSTWYRWMLLDNVSKNDLAAEFATNAAARSPGTSTVRGDESTTSPTSTASPAVTPAASRTAGCDSTRCPRISPPAKRNSPHTPTSANTSTPTTSYRTPRRQHTGSVARTADGEPPDNFARKPRVTPWVRYATSARLEHPETTRPGPMISVESGAELVDLCPAGKCLALRLWPRVCRGPRPLSAVLLVPAILVSRRRPRR
jgi:hypothetical protein